MSNTQDDEDAKKSLCVHTQNKSSVLQLRLCVQPMANG